MDLTKKMKQVWSYCLPVSAFLCFGTEELFLHPNRRGRRWFILPERLWSRSDLLAEGARLKDAIKPEVLSGG